MKLVRDTIIGEHHKYCIYTFRLSRQSRSNWSCICDTLRGYLEWRSPESKNQKLDWSNSIKVPKKRKKS